MSEPVLIARMWKDYSLYSSVYSTDFEPRILYYKYEEQLSGSDKRSWKWKTTSNVETFVPTALPNGFGIGNIWSLDYNSSTKKGLFENFYARMMSVIEDGTLLTANFNLKDTDIQALDFSKPIHIKRPENIAGYWAINKVKDYKPNLNESTEVELFKLINLDPVTITQETLLDGDGTIPGGGYDFPRPVPVVPGSGTAGTGVVSSSFDNVSLVQNNNSSNQAPLGSGAYALGQNSIASADYQGVVGQFNNVDPDALFIIGGGEDDDNRLNAMKVNSDGSLQVQGGEVFVDVVTGSETLTLPVTTLIDDTTKYVYLTDE